jgi:hypothetical protein
MPKEIMFQNNSERNRYEGPSMILEEYNTQAHVESIFSEFLILTGWFFG